VTPDRWRRTARAVRLSGGGPESTFAQVKAVGSLTAVNIRKPVVEGVGILRHHR